MEVDVVTRRIIRRPPKEVSAFAADPDRVPEWYVNIRSVEWRTERPLRVGARLAFVARFLGRRLEYTYEVVDWVPGERFVMRTTEGPFPMETTYTWSQTPEGHTVMTLRNRGTPTGFSRLVAPFMQAAMRRATRRDLAQLAARLERDAPS
jgi:uncharacterized protein YndB with AHSA1/START domain